MRIVMMLPIVCLAGGVGLLGCGGDKDEETTDTDDGNGTTGDDPTNKGDTAWATVAWVGDAVVDEVGGTYTGTQSIVITSVQSGETLCDYEWTALDWEHDPTTKATSNPITAACENYYTGDACDFSFTMNMTQGAHISGDLCDVFGVDETWLNDYWWGVGYIDDYMVKTYGYGPTFMYYFEYYGAWYYDGTYATWDGSNFYHVYDYLQAYPPQ